MAFLEVINSQTPKKKPRGNHLSVSQQKSNRELAKIGCVVKTDVGLGEVAIVITAQNHRHQLMNSKSPFKWHHFRADIILWGGRSFLPLPD